MNVVDSFTVEVNIEVREFDNDGDLVYDWISNSGAESDVLFDTPAEALRDARGYFGV